MSIYGTTELSYQIEQLIQEESNFLIIVSPYLKVNKRLQARLTNSFNNIKHVLFLYRDKELNRTEQEWLSKHSNVKLLPIENLHAKIYLNQWRGLITSMNLYEYSQINNHEIGVEVNSNDNSEEFLKMLEEIKLMVQSNNYEFNFEEICDMYRDFTFGQLFLDLLERFNLPRNQSVNYHYTNFCNWARTTVNFNSDELYQDETAVLRSTTLDKYRYSQLKQSATIESITNTHNNR